MGSSRSRVQGMLETGRIIGIGFEVKSKTRVEGIMKFTIKEPNIR